ncbi:MerR family transcriptional regulator [Schlesneria paludicola]|uniref:MerR family transcriptional regulator n=1 Tax=Schlesneria paludicola TaxID=360056 RepID=UPI00029B4C2F|nr:helix-turn-helix domain-containing protein [Schlesneria paludicola]
MESTHSLLSPKSAALALGVSESSVKRWCDRGLIETIRTAGGHRKIATGEIIHFAQKHGSLLAAPERMVLSLPAVSAETSIADTATQFAEHLLAGDALAVRQILIGRFLRKEPLSLLFDNLITVAFRIIGARWSCSSADVYQERRGCSIVLDVFQELKEYLRPGLPRQFAIGATTTDDHYEIPSAMAELVLRTQRYQTQNLGTAIPFHSLAKAVKDLQPQLFWLSASHIADEADFIKGFEKLSSACSENETALVVGGRALSDAIRPRLVYSAYCDTMQQLATFAASVQRLKTGPNAAGRKRPVRTPNAMRRGGDRNADKRRPRTS